MKNWSQGIKIVDKSFKEKYATFLSFSDSSDLADNFENNLEYL